MRPARTGAFDRRLLAPMMLGTILNPINTAIIAVALTPIGLALGAPTSDTVWLVSSLYLATSIGQPLVGRLVDLFGAKTLFLIGGALVAVAGAIGLVAPDIWWLVGARVILGLGTCAGYPAAMHLIRSEAERTGMRSPAGILTALSVTTQTIAVIGPTLGGLLIAGWGWRATFAVNLPLGVACLVLGWILIPKHDLLIESRAAGATSPRIDWLGIGLFAVAMLALLVYLQNLAVGLLWLLAVAIVAGAAFVWWELRTRVEPFIDVRVLGGNVPLLLTYIRATLTSIVAYCFVYGFTQWLEDGRGLDATSSGLILLPVFAVGIVFSVAFGRRPEVRWKLLVGSAGQIVAGALVLWMTDDAPIWLLVAAMVALGIPQGLNNLAIQNSLYFQAEPTRIASSAGLLRTFMYLGAIISSVVYGAFYGARATTTGLHDLGWFIVGVALAFLVLTVLDRSLARVGRQLPDDVAAAEERLAAASETP